MQQRIQEVTIQVGLQFETNFQNNRGELTKTEDGQADLFNKLFEKTQEHLLDQGQDEIRMEMMDHNGQLLFQTWKIQFKGEDNSEYQDKLIEGLLVLPKDFPDKPPKFYFGFFKDGSKIIHENIYGDGLLCMPRIVNNWNKTNNIPDLLLAIRDIFNHPNNSDPANPIFSNAPQVEKKRRRKLQAQSFEDW